MNDVLMTVLTTAALFAALALVGYAVGRVDDRRRREGRR